MLMSHIFSNKEAWVTLQDIGTDLTL